MIFPRIKQTIVSTSAYKINWISPTDKIIPKAMDFFRQYFYANEDLLKCANVNNNINDDKKYLDLYYGQIIKKGASLVVLNNHDKIICLGLCDIYTRKENMQIQLPSSKNFKTSKELDAIINLTNKIISDTDLFGKYPWANKIMDFCGTVTDPNWQNKKIMSTTSNIFIEVLAPNLDIDIMFGICSSFKTEHCLLKHKFRRIWAMRNCDLIHNGKPMFPKLDQNKLITAIMRLQNNKKQFV